MRSEDKTTIRADGRASEGSVRDADGRSAARVVKGLWRMITNARSTTLEAVRRRILLGCPPSGL